MNVGDDRRELLGERGTFAYEASDPELMEKLEVVLFSAGEDRTIEHRSATCAARRYMQTSTPVIFGVIRSRSSK
jgi:hypothetical protein